MALKLYNSLSKKLEDFVPIEKGTVRMYSCGPTVYSATHIGNYRTYLFEDLLKKSLDFLGYKTVRGINITDVGHLVGDTDGGDDKFDVASRKENKSPLEIARFYEERFLLDLELLNIQKPTTVVRATDSIPESLTLIEKLLARKYAYITEKAIYFDTAQWEPYATLFGRQKADRKEAARENVVLDTDKKNPEDFALWFFLVGKYEKHILHWPSSWGEGFPGWHIECSAISRKILGQPFDIHTGGIDLRETHHPNEIAQSMAGYQSPLANYWLHGEHLVTDVKMSKSLGNVITPTELQTQGYHPLSFRYLALLTHYRQKMHFTFDSLEAAQKAYQHLIETYFDLETQAHVEGTSIFTPPAVQITELKTLLENDLNLPAVLALVWDTLKDSRFSPSEKIGFVDCADRIFSLDIKKTSQSLRVTPSVQMKELLQERTTARASGNFTRSDEIRDYFLSLGIEIRDTKLGSTLRKIID